MTNIHPLFGARPTPQAANPQAAKNLFAGQFPHTADSVDIRFGGKAAEPEVSEHDFIASLPRPYRMAIARAQSMAEATESPVTIDKIVAGMLALVNEHFAEILTPSGTDANINSEDREALQEIFFAIFPPEKLIEKKPEEIQTIIDSTLQTAQQAIQESVKAYKKQTKPSDKPGHLSELTRNFLEYTQGEGGTPNTLVSEILKCIPATDIDPTVQLRHAVSAGLPTGIPTEFKMARVLLDQCVLENLTRDESTASASTSTALVVASGSNVEALTTVQFVNAIREKSPVLGSLIDNAVEEAYYQGDTLDLKHLMLALAKTAARVDKNPDAKGKLLQALKEDDRKIRYALEALIPQEELRTLNATRASGVAKSIASSIEPLVGDDNVLNEKKTIGDEQKSEVISKMSPGLKKLLAEFLKQDRRDVYGFTDFLKNSISGSDQYPAEYHQLMSRIATARRDSINGQSTQYADTPEEFRELLDEQFAKGVMTPEQKEAISGLIEKMKQRGSDEQAQLRQRLQVLLNEMNWDLTENNPDAAQTRAILNESHYGMDPLKDKIEDYIGVLENQQKKGLPYEGRILCFVGPPGTGKTSLALAAARATGRKVASVAMGGEDDVTKIRGFHHTYKNSAQGAIVDALIEAGSMNPVMVFDEIDKLAKSHRGSPADAMLEVLDPKQNKGFKDNFLGREIPINLSNSLIICTANNLENIPEPLRDRMDIVELPGYDVEEKVNIAQQHLIPLWREKRGLSEKQFSMSDEAVRGIINNYTFEDGVRQLEREISSISDKLVQPGRRQRGPVRPEQLEGYLGVPEPTAQYLKPDIQPPTIGRVNKLSVMGGKTGLVQAGLVTVDRTVVSRPGDETYTPGKISLSDLHKNQGEMSYDSTNRAFRWVRHNLERLGISLEPGTQYTVNFTSESGGPVDGDSAGAAITTAIVSAMTNRPIDNMVAMTGTITEHGRVGAIGGLDKKLRGVANANLEVAFCPIKNDLDFERMSKDAPGLYAKYAKLVITAEDLQKGMDPVATIEKAKAAAKAEGKILLVEVDRIEPILMYTLLPELPQEELAELNKPIAFRTAPRFGGNLRQISGKRLNLVS